MFSFLVKKIDRLGLSLRKRFLRFCMEACRHEKMFGAIMSDDRLLLDFINAKQQQYCDISFSQYGQDIFVKAYYASKPHKDQYFFVDIGANDGKNISNTYMLENSTQSIGKPQIWGGGDL